MFDMSTLLILFVYTLNLILFQRSVAFYIFATLCCTLQCSVAFSSFATFCCSRVATSHSKTIPIKTSRDTTIFYRTAYRTRYRTQFLTSKNPYFTRLSNLINVRFLIFSKIRVDRYDIGKLFSLQVLSAASVDFSSH